MKILIQTCLVMSSAVSFGFGFNETFSTPNFAMYSDATGDGAITPTVETSGGNPDACLQLAQSTNFGSEFKYVVMEDQWYDPNVEGTLGSVTFSVDFLPHYDLLQGPTSPTVDFEFYLMQGDGVNLNMSKVSRTFVTFEDAWTTGFGTWNVADFTPVTAAFDPNEPLRFGFGFKENLPFQARSYWRIDNFNVNATAVPEPATLTVLAGLALLRKRKQNQK